MIVICCLATDTAKPCDNVTWLCIMNYINIPQLIYIQSQCYYNNIFILIIMEHII